MAKSLTEEAQRVISSLKMNVLKELTNTKNVRAEVRLKTWDILEKAFKKSEQQLKVNLNLNETKS